MGAVRVPHRQPPSTVDDHRRRARLPRPARRRTTAAAASHAVHARDDGVHAGGDGGRAPALKLELLHLCDSLFPIGAFAYSDGFEAAATVRLKPHPVKTPAASDQLRDWIDVVLDESIGRLEGPAVWQAWLAVVDGDWPALIALDEELIAIRPSSASRSSSRAMGHRLLTTWRALHPDERLAQVPPSTALPIAFAAVCACGEIARRESVEAYAYTRLAAT